MVNRLFPLLLCLTLVSGIPFAQAEDVPSDMPLLFEDSFDKGMERWEPTCPEGWSVAKDGDRTILDLGKDCSYEPEVRSPVRIAWIKDLDVGDFVLDFEGRQTGREYGHRDMCLFFGKQDDSHFYYVHLASVADDHANSIFLVNGEPRVSIAKKRTDGTKWSQGYHHIRVKRDVESGSIEVFFDDMDKPVMTTVDKHFSSGTIGLGSFDDEGHYDNVKIWGKSLKK